MDALLTLDDIACARAGMPVLAGVTLALMPGKALILRGPNGSGKTTLLRTIAGLQPALHGRIAGGEDRIAYAGHADGIKHTLSVAENLEFWAGVYGGGSIDAALEAFDLIALQGRAAQSLSAGQKRRLGLARLMVTGRPIWALDEPTVSLDAASVALFAKAVRGHLAGGGAAIMATHIDLGIEADVLDLSGYRAGAPDGAFDRAFDEAFS
ncbi:MAG: heme exporter protein A [Halocynthiibacter sp.]|jgi:heme exporter protein A